MFGRLCVLLGCLVVPAVHCERLPVRAYPISEGLQAIRCIVGDSKGFLWFCTPDGLHRFDGERYTHFGAAQGLPDRGAVDFLETRDGELWVATAAGLARLRPHTFPSASAAPLFELYRLPPDPKIRIAEGAVESQDGGIWFLTSTDLFRFDRHKKMYEWIAQSPGASTLFCDRDGSLWIGDDAGLIRRGADGRVERFGVAEGLPQPPAPVSTIYRDRQDRLWVGTWKGLCLMAPHPEPGKLSVAQVFTERDGLAGRVIQAIYQTRAGKLWVGVEGGLSELETEGRAHFRSYTAQTGLDLRDDGIVTVSALAEDAAGNLWMTPGPMRAAANGFTTYTVQDGLKDNSIGSIREDLAGRLVATAGYHTNFLEVFHGTRFASIAPRLPDFIDKFGWGTYQVHMEDHTGVWWIPTGKGLCRYPRGKRIEQLASTMPERVYTVRDGLPGDDIFRLFEDSRGDVWISVIGGNVTLWSRVADRFQNFKAGEAGRQLGTPISFAEDRAGNIWMGFYWRDMARYSNGRFRVFTTEDGLPDGVVQSLFVDHVGRLWGATTRGLVRIDDPAAEKPSFQVYTTRSGLSDNFTRGITEDQWGRVYVSTNRGVDRIEPETGKVHHYGQADGIPWAGQAYRDRDGALWFGSAGLKRFVPQREDGSRTAPPVRITRLVVHGADVPISELGESRISGLRLPASQSPVEIQFAGTNFDLGETIRYQYKLGSSNWGNADDSTSVTYANISAGTYRFEVRAVRSDGTASASPAIVAFTVLPPWYQQWWFIGSTALVMALALWGAHRFRLRQVLELERVRTRIATDLHDDIGSSLTQIAILSEVARRHVESDAAQAAPPLARIADLSRELVDSMSDIVWAINPRRDRLDDLVHRMRRFANDVFPPRGIEFEFDAPATAEDVTVSAELRREVFLIFKECVHNIVRHSGCRRAQFGVRVEFHRFYLWVRDDGKGMSEPGNGQGHGLTSMEQRVRRLGGHWKVASARGHGTTISVDIPLGTRENRYLNR